MTTVTMEIRTKTFDVQTHHTRVKLSESFVMSTYRTQFWIRDRVWWHFARQFFRWSDSKFSASAEISTSPPPPPYQKPHFPSFRLPFQVETFTPCLQRRLLTGGPPSSCSSSSIQAGNPHPTPILLLLPHPTCPDRQRKRDTFHPNHQPLHQISASLCHDARSIARISRSIWQRRSKSRPHARMRSRWLPFVPTPRSWRSTLPFASYAG